MRSGKARTGLSARLAWHTHRNACGNCFAVRTRAGSRMRESRMYGSVRGARGNSRPYRERFNLLHLLRTGLVQVFGRGRRQFDHTLRRPASEKRQGTKSRRRVGRRRCRGRYGDLATGRELKAGRFTTAIRLDRGHNLNVPARMLLNGDFTFCPICDFNELSVAK